MAGKNSRTNERGKGWFGDSAGHAAAGRKGGKARGRRKNNQSEELSSATIS